VKAERLPDGTEPKNPGEFAWMPYSSWEWKPSFFLGDGEWHLADPTGRVGAIGRHWIETTDKGAKVEHPPAHTWEIHADDAARHGVPRAARRRRLDRRRRRQRIAPPQALPPQGRRPRFAAEWKRAYQEGTDALTGRRAGAQSKASTSPA
jgi:hypothetical protein